HRPDPAHRAHHGSTSPSAQSPPHKPRPAPVHLNCPLEQTNRLPTPRAGPADHARTQPALHTHDPLAAPPSTPPALALVETTTPSTRPLVPSPRTPRTDRTRAMSTSAAVVLEAYSLWLGGGASVYRDE